MEPKFCIFKDVNSLEIGLHIERLPEDSVPAQRFESVVIPGRDGALTVTDGTFETFTQQVEFVVWDASYLEQVRSVFRGSGWLTLSTAPDRRRRVFVGNQIDFSPLISRLRRFPVEFTCQPFAYERYPQSYDNPKVLYNLGNLPALPTVEIAGTGDVTLSVNGNPFTLLGLTGGAILDTENLLARDGTRLIYTQGDFDSLKLQIGQNTLSWTDGIQVRVTPNWRWL